MAKKSGNDSAAFEDYLLQLARTSEARPFTAEEVWQILHRHGMPKDLASYRDEKRIEAMKQIHAEQRARAEADFCEPSRMRALGELLESVLVLKGLFISQLAQRTGISVEDIESYVEKRLPSQPLQEAQLARLAEISGLALEEVRRIALATPQHEEEQSAKTNRASAKPPRVYPTGPSRFGAGMIRDADD